MLRITDAFSFSEADSQFAASQQKSPVCARFAHLDWGYEKFSLSEAGGTSSAFCKSLRGCMVCYLWITKMIYMQRPSAKRQTAVSHLVKRPMDICRTAVVPSPVKLLDMITQPIRWYGNIRSGRMESVEWLRDGNSKAAERQRSAAFLYG